MAHPTWLNKYLKMKPEVKNIFDELENYQKFCKEFGYVYDERHLHNERTPYGEYIKMTKGREPWDQWRSPRRVVNKDKAK